MGNSSRSQRFSQAQDKVVEAKSEVEMLRDELQEWLDNMPENLQASLKADELQETIDTLDECIENLDNVETAEVLFPGMF